MSHDTAPSVIFRKASLSASDEDGGDLCLWHSRPLVVVISRAWRARFKTSPTPIPNRSITSRFAASRSSSVMLATRVALSALTWALQSFELDCCDLASSAKSFGIDSTIGGACDRSSVLCACRLRAKALWERCWTAGNPWTLELICRSGVADLLGILSWTEPKRNWPLCDIVTR